MKIQKRSTLKMLAKAVPQRQAAALRKASVPQESRFETTQRATLKSASSVAESKFETAQLTASKPELAPQPAEVKKKKKGFFGSIKDAFSGPAKKLLNVAKTAVARGGDILHGLGSGLRNTVTGAAKNLAEGIRTFSGGIGKLFQGKFGEGFKEMGRGLVKTFVQTPVDSVLMMGGRVVSAIQTAIGVEPVGRKLAGSEIAELRKIYGDSIDFSRVKIKEGNAGLLTSQGRPFTHGDTIYFPKGSLPIRADVLAHEMAHVWQHQNGGTDYMSEALYAQFLGDGYDFAKGLKQGKEWKDLNPEQQAELISEAKLSGYFDQPGRRFVVSGTDYTAQLEAALKQIRAGRGAG